MSKKFWLGFVAVFIVFEVLIFLVDGLILAGAYRSVQIWRPDMMSLMWVYHVITLVSSFFFTFVFSKGFENKGVMEGVRYGLYIGVWMSVGMAFGTYAMVAISFSLALQWFIYGVIEYIIAGVVLSLIYKGEKTKATAA